MKILIYTTYGCFCFTSEAKAKFTELTGIPLDSAYSEEYRTSPVMIKILEDNPEFAGNLKIVDVPDDVDWEIEDYDGVEWVAEKHRTWS